MFTTMGELIISLFRPASPKIVTNKAKKRVQKNNNNNNNETKYQVGTRVLF